MKGNTYSQIKQILKTIATILSWTLFMILILIIGFLAYYMISANMYAKNGEKYHPKFSLYTIVSPSMEPKIKVYDVVVNTRIDDPGSIKPGDVITFISTSNISKGMTVTHRVVSVKKTNEGYEYLTKGDNNLSEDSDTAKSQNLIGKVIMKIPQLGRLQFFLSSNGGWLLVIIFPALYIIVSDIFKIIKLKKAKNGISSASEREEHEKEEQIELEAFRKEEIKEKIREKNIKKGKNIETKLKDHNSKQ